ncbi:MAG: tripartite tricarboxylate transporter TctB family protein [Gammaproteobacteria bacterium]|nr:tripartite tricarboxylate transporter TctB family protein [Gammaproteobacteria bacterium]NIR90644.1 tripartite tricarboxylate transporter TctB family protein [Gammaproteobacteria bacterium]NIU07024.1 tripartite tricarboxylate transporter TctB family protein [Gammaproteobacteria bacterium]NIV53934.1 hypothetical protein [Gammaproteobacteria bacterium]NIW86164.1 hypothetical protein [Gammaproteobacteria bacterium]
MRVNDAIIGAAIIVIALGLMFTAADFPAMPGVPYGANVFPQVVCGILVLAGAILVFGGIGQARARGRLVELDAWARRPRTWLQFGLVVGGLLLYIFASEPLGFPLTAFLILLPMLLVLRGRRHALSSCAIAAIFPIVIHLAFAKWLRVPLPEGPFPGLF